MKNSALLLLRISLASTFLYVAMASFITPSNWIGYFPPFIRSLAPSTVLLTGFSLYEIVISLWLLSGWKTFLAALLAAFTLLGIILPNLAQIDVIFRDIGLFFAALALAAATFPTKE